MAAASSWVADNWFNLVQSAGVILTLLFAAVGVHREAKAREVENLITLSEHHRSLWSLAAGRKDLERIFMRDADVDKQPPSVAETQFLNLFFVHAQVGWSVARSGGITTLDEMRADLRDFLSLPVPNAVWTRTKAARNRLFVRFVEQAVENTAQDS